MAERLIAVQFSDLRGFSSFTAEHGDEKAFRIARDFVDLVGTKVNEHGGTLLKTYGDGVMTSFDDAEQAVQCAAEMQETLSNTYAGRDDESGVISAGIGLTWGTAIRTDGDLFGHSVNLAKRLADEAKGGQIVASSALIEVAGTLQRISYRDMGQRSLKGVGDYQLYEIVWRPEVVRVETSDDYMDIVLTDDHKIIVELGKSMKETLDEVIDKLQAEADDAGENPLARFIKRRVAGRIAKSLPTWVDWAQSRAGLGIEHEIDDVTAEFVKNGLVINLGPKKKSLTFPPEEIDAASARAFVERLNRMKTDAGTS